jgi:hypothetical protein
LQKSSLLWSCKGEGDSGSFRRDRKFAQLFKNFIVDGSQELVTDDFLGSQPTSIRKNLHLWDGVR